MDIRDYINLAERQATKFNLNEQRRKQGIKQAIALYCRDSSMHKVWLSNFTDEKVIISAEEVEGYQEGRAMYDPSHRQLFVATNEKLISFPYRNVFSLNYAQDVAIRHGKADAKNDHCHDGRHSSYFFVEDSEAEYATTDNKIQYNDYLIMNIMMNDDEAERLRDHLFSEDKDSTTLLVNHKNNDTRDISADNLEFVSSTLNQLHGAYVSILAMSDKADLFIKERYYSAKSLTSKTGSYKNALTIKLSAYDVAVAVGKSIDYLVEKYHLGGGEHNV